MNEKNSLGEIFRQKREEKKISIKNVCDVTKLSKSIILAIESDNFEDLPGGFFNRGILRTYAKFLKLDEEEIIRIYENIYKKDGEKKEKILTIDKEYSFNFLSKKVIFVFLAILILLLLIWLFIPSDFSVAKVENIKKITQMKGKTQKGVKKAINKEIMRTKSEPIKKVINNNKKRDFSEEVKVNKDELALKLIFKDDCWTEIRSGNKIIVSSLFLAGNGFKAKGKVFSIKLGNPGAAEIFVNGKIYQFEYKEGIPKTLILSYKDF